MADKPKTVEKQTGSAVKKTATAKTAAKPAPPKHGGGSCC